MPLPVLEINAGTQSAIEFAKRFPGKFAAALLPSANVMGLVIASGITSTQFQGDPLNTVTGMLKGSIAHRVVVIGNSIVIAIGVLKGPATKYARIQEEGGTVRAKPGKALAVPLPAAITGGGRPKYPAGPRGARVKRDFAFTFIHRKKGSGRAPVIWGAKKVAGGGSRTVLTPLFALVKSVQVTPSNYLSEGIPLHLDAGGGAFASEMDRLLFAA